MRDTTRIKPIKSNKPLAQPKKPAKKSGVKPAPKTASKKSGAQYPTFSDQKKRSTSAKKPAAKRDESVLFYKSSPPKGQKQPQRQGNPKSTRRSYGTKHKRKQNNAFLSVAALMMMVGGVLLFVCFGPNRQYAASYITDIQDSFLAMEEEFQQEETPGTVQDVPSLMDRAEENAQTLVDNGTIESFEVGEDCVYMETEDGLGMVYLPDVNTNVPEDEEAAAAPTPTPTPESTPTPTPTPTTAPTAENTAAPSQSVAPNQPARRVISLQPCYDMFLSSFTTAELENIDESAARFGTLDGFSYNPALDDYDNAACTVDLLKSLGEYDVIIWEGHGGYSSATGSFLLTGQAYTEEFHRQNAADFSDGSLISTTDGLVAVTAGFFEKYLAADSLDGAIVYLAACSTSTDERLVSTLLSKGAETVYANSGVIYTVYNYAVLDRVTSALCGQTGSFSTASEALTDAQLLYGYYDNYRLTPQAGAPTNYAVVQLFGNGQLRLG